MDEGSLERIRQKAYLALAKWFQWVYTVKNQNDKNAALKEAIMTKDWVINKGQSLIGIFDNKEARQAVIIAVTPILLLAGYYIWAAPQADDSDERAVLSMEDRAIENSASESAQLKDSAKPKVVQIKIDIGGAVNSPGLIELPEGSRVNDAIESAGGLNEYADRQYIAQALNLAQKLQDGDKLYLPTYYEVSIGMPAPKALVNKVGDPLTVVVPAETHQTSTKTDSKSDQSSDTKKQSLININSASQSELESLPGIGPKFAEYIIDHRPYVDTADICQPDIVNRESTCKEIQDLITI